MPPSATSEGESLGLLAAMDIYWIDQLLRGRVEPGMRILDAGCGQGRNLAYLARRGYAVFGVDRDGESIRSARDLLSSLAPDFDAARLLQAPVEEMGFEDGSFDWVVSNAVLHFANDEEHFDRMVREMWRVVAPGGHLFARLATSIGLPPAFSERGNTWYALPDGSDRFLVDERKILALSSGLRGALADPLKTTLVQNLRSMTTWVLRKPEISEPGDDT